MIQKYTANVGLNERWILYLNSFSKYFLVSFFLFVFLSLYYRGEARLINGGNNEIDI